ncbi:hypothetical protein DSL92_07005 [Billgrantia gudaonensis]|uniref:Uncharacterized protein n=1 Tax=Billgrantia gudaonensis TaxID=376427 RepID=A0A3S0NH51_9GAMM|nr:hypothetical protein DSL92_07005 [Halomonas gudaonensis]
MGETMIVLLASGNTVSDERQPLEHYLRTMASIAIQPPETTQRAALTIVCCCWQYALRIRFAFLVNTLAGGSHAAGSSLSSFGWIGMVWLANGSITVGRSALAAPGWPPAAWR